MAQFPAKAIQLLHYRDVQVEAEIMALLEPEIAGVMYTTVDEMSVAE